VATELSNVTRGTFSGEDNIGKEYIKIPKVFFTSQHG
jgi:hypothetical protein